MSSYGFKKKRVYGPRPKFDYGNFRYVNWDAARKHARQFETPIRESVRKKMNGASDWVPEVVPPQFDVPGIEIILLRKANGVRNSRDTIDHKSGVACYTVITQKELQQATKELTAIVKKIAPENMKLIRLLPPVSDGLGGVGSRFGPKLIFRVSIDDYSQFLSKRHKKKRDSKAS